MSATMASARRAAESKRIQFEFSPDAVERLDNMKKLTEKSSYADVVRDALRVYEWIVQQEKAGYDFGLVKGDTLVKTIKFVL